MTRTPQRVVIFGAGNAAQLTYANLCEAQHVLGFVDNDAAKSGTQLSACITTNEISY